MQTRHTETFKIEAVKTTLSHNNGISITKVAKNLG
jgi:transposase-like protein